MAFLTALRVCILISERLGFDPSPLICGPSDLGQHKYCTYAPSSVKTGLLALTSEMRCAQHRMAHICAVGVVASIT